MTDIELIKSKIDIVELIGEYVTLKKSGRNFTACCPFHAEKSPSFYVSPERQIWHCFGACNEGGDVISFIMKQERLEFPEALKELADRTGIQLTDSFSHDKNWQQKERLYEMNHLASEYYHYILTKHQTGAPGREYLASRNIHPKLAETFMLGYAPSGWHNLLSFLKKKGYQEEEIETAGLIVHSSGRYYDRFRGRFMFTLHDHRGQTVGLSGRVLGTVKQAKYINSPETPIYHKSNVLYGLFQTKDAIKQAGYAIFCEGEFDVLSAFQAGISNIVAIKGTALTQEQLRLIKRFVTDIRLGLDMDIAGDQAARRSIELADSMDLTVRVIEIPGGKDIDEAVRTNTPDLKKAIEHAESVYDFVLSSARKRHTGASAETKKKISSEVIPLYARITNPIVRDHYVKLLASILDVSESAVAEQVSVTQKKSHLHQPVTAPDRIVHTSAEDMLSLHLLALIIQSSNPLQYLHLEEITRTIQTLPSGPVQRILNLLSSATPDTIQTIDSLLPKELVDTYNRAYLQDITTLLADKKLFEKELARTIVALKKLVLKKQLKKVSQDMKGQSDLTEVNAAFQKISHELSLLDKR